jgi:hypothetical protein
MQSRSTNRGPVSAHAATSPTANADTVVAVFKHIDNLIKQWHAQSTERTDAARRLTGRERMAAEMHARVLRASADELRSVVVKCGLEAGVPAKIKRSSTR